MKLKLSLLKNRLIYLIYCIIVLTISYFTKRFVQMLIFILMFNYVQSCFANRFHAEYIVENNYIKASRLCKLITVIVEIIYLCLCGNLDVSLYWHVFIILAIATLNASLGKVFETILFKELKYCDYATLNKLCEMANVTNNARERLIKHYIDKKTIKEIAYDESVEIQAVKMSINRSKKKIENAINGKVLT